MKKIEIFVFFCCSSLKQVELTYSVEGIGYYAFMYCYSLVYVKTGTGLRKRGHREFLESDNLTLKLTMTSITFG